MIPGPTLLAALIFQAADPAEGSTEFYALLAGAVLLTLALNLSSVGVLMDILDGHPLRLPVRAFSGFAPTVALAIPMTLTIAAGYVDVGMPALAALLIAVTGAGYMLRLVAGSREQAREYANLSWGVLSSLVRTLNERDDRASRHSAAVARFSRDMADVAGLDPKQVELAHTSGLLHDIGKFVLSDRVMERGTRLTEVDWRGIRRHPDIGADLLRDIGVFGPGRGDRALPSRARRRPRLSARPDRRGDPGGREDRRRRRGLRHAHRAGHLPHADELLRGAARAAPRLRLTARRGIRRDARRACWPAAASSTATPTRRTSTSSWRWSGGSPKPPT